MGKQENEKNRTPTVSRLLSNGRIVELVYSPEEKRTKLAILENGEVSLVDDLALETGDTLVPVSASNNLIKHAAVVLPERPEPLLPRKSIRFMAVWEVR